MIQARPRFDPDALAPLLASFEGTTVPQWLLERLEAGLGGVVYFGYNTPNPHTAATLSTLIRSASQRTPVIAIDEEAGDVTRLFAESGSPSPAARGFGEVSDPALTRVHAAALGKTLQACGISLNFAPVADVLSSPHNLVIGTRAFGTDAAKVIEHAGAVCAGLHDAGILSCVKHFPGHGDTTVDSHVGLPTVPLDTEQFEKDHLVAFTALSAVVDALMTAHVCVPALGDGPASISAWAGELAGRTMPEALIVTDALDMGAITQSCGYGEACVRALEAGAHLLCLGTSIRRDGESMVSEAHDAIHAALTSGRVSRAALRARAATVAARLEHSNRHAPSANLDQALADYEKIALVVAARAVRWAHPTGRAPLTSASQKSANTVQIVDARVVSDFAAGHSRNFLRPALEHRGFTVRAASDGHGPSVEHHAEVPADLTVILTKHWKAHAAEIQKVQKALAYTTAGEREAVVVHTGIPENADESLAPYTVLSFGASRGSMQATANLIATRWMP